MQNTQVPEINVKKCTKAFRGEGLNPENLSTEYGLAIMPHFQLFLPLYVSVVAFG